MFKSNIIAVYLWSVFAAFFNPAFANEIAFIAPTTGPNAIIGDQITRGARSAIEGADSRPSVYDDGCDPALAVAKTDKAILDGAKLIIGLPCVEALDAAAEHISLIDADAIILSLDVQVPDVTSREGRPNWPVFRLGPIKTQEAETIAGYLKEAWRETNFAIIDDGTLYGRQLAETVRFLLEEDNLKPVFTDTYRPLLDRQAGLVRRIAKSGATHVFIGGDAYDAAIIGKDARALNVDLKIAGGAALRAPKDEGTLPNSTVFTAPRSIAIEGNETELGYFEALTIIAGQIAGQVVKYAQQNTIGYRQAMTAKSYDTSLGQIRFGKDGENNIVWFDIYSVVNGEYLSDGGIN